MVGFDAKDLNNYSILLQNSYSKEYDVQTCWSLYTQSGEKFMECDKGKIYKFTDKDYYIIFAGNKKGYTLEKVKY